MSAYTNVLGKLVESSPEKVSDVTGDYVVYRYRSTLALLTTNRPAYNDAWGAANEYVVRSVRGPTQVGFSLLYEMTVEVATYNITGSTQIVNSEWPVYEIDWAPEEKDLLAHPAFATLTAAQRTGLQAWIDEKVPTVKAALGYRVLSNTGTFVSVTTLGTAASPTNSEQDFATLWLEGIQSYRDFNPVARKTSLFSGTDKPTVGTIGAKIGGDPFSGVPSGFEWVKMGDSARKQGSGFTWTRSEEWIGVRKVRCDIDNVYP